MKSTISMLAIVLVASSLAVLAGCTESAQPPAAENAALSAPVPDGMLRGTVLETMDAGGYTYVAIETEQEPVWAAGPQTSVSVGDVVMVPAGMLMNQFASKTLNRVFDQLYFVNVIMNLTAPAEATASAVKTSPAKASPSKPAAAKVADVNVDALEAGQDIAWVFANSDTLADQQVSLRGKVVKYNSNILGWNFIHIRDGSGDAADGNNDLTVTSKDAAVVGETVVLTGTIILDKDFGAGYSFPVLLEDASIAVE